MIPQDGLVRLDHHQRKNNLTTTIHKSLVPTCSSLMIFMMVLYAGSRCFAFSRPSLHIVLFSKSTGLLIYVEDTVLDVTSLNEFQSIKSLLHSSLKIKDLRWS
ncbi:hypothetical protein L195_g007004 [Trifolium pratense]|uniref:Uncharacterized protein n=1 Tax=Trifolium pratense TaxID=57577 RepID=A0A2K3M0N3_TRIPR|nr:hypothetical protein L195_g040394 [Trifolium pratense]PNX84383.1 hypothetical protein L195_g040443 [Trifolium pratense]PNY10427.1 hypothetical protein L195_g007004 [Trifolium pratense]